MNALLARPLSKSVAFLLGLLPLAYLVYAVLMDTLGANPAEALIRSTGDWTLRFLCVVLAISPLRVTLSWTALARYRRMAGLWVYIYAVLHTLSYVGFDRGFDVAEVATDIVKRPFILVGFCAIVLLTPLALTSFNGAIRWLGAKRWQCLHQAVYCVAALAVLHFFWMRAGKRNFTEVAVYASILGVLLGWRLVRRFRKPISAVIH